MKRKWTALMLVFTLLLTLNGLTGCFPKKAKYSAQEIRNQVSAIGMIHYDLVRLHGAVIWASGALNSFYYIEAYKKRLIDFENNINNFNVFTENYTSFLAERINALNEMGSLIGMTELSYEYGVMLKEIVSGYDSAKTLLWQMNGILRLPAEADFTELRTKADEIKSHLSTAQKKTQQIFRTTSSYLLSTFQGDSDVKNVNRMMFDCNRADLLINDILFCLQDVLNETLLLSTEKTRDTSQKANEMKASLDEISEILDVLTDNRENLLKCGKDYNVDLSAYSEMLNTLQSNVIVLKNACRLLLFPQSITGDELIRSLEKLNEVNVQIADKSDGFLKCVVDIGWSLQKKIEAESK